MFENITTAAESYGKTDASLEIYFILAIAFVLGFLFCYLQSKQDEES